MVQKKKEKARFAIVVLCMHRSGSSALTRILGLLGCDMPKTLMAATQANEAGHWESEEICNLNDAVLASGGSSWRDWLPFNPNWYDTARFSEFVTRAREVLVSEFDASPLFVVKDPRMSRLFPLWKSALTEESCDIHVVIPIRHPQEVAASLKIRDGMLEISALLLWLRHVLEAEHASRGLSRAFLNYAAVIEEPTQIASILQEKLELYWPRLSPKTLDEIANFVRADLRHHEFGATIQRQYLLRDWLQQVYDIVMRWSRDGESESDYAALDKVNAEIEQFTRILYGVVQEMDKQYHSIDAKNKENVKLNSAASDLNSKLQSLNTDLSQVIQDRDEYKVQLDEKNNENLKLNNATDELNSKLHSLSANLSQVLQERDGYKINLDDFSAKYKELESRQEDECRTLNQMLDAFRAENAELRFETERTAERLLSHEDEVQTLRSALIQRSLEAEEGVIALSVTEKQLEATQGLYDQINIEQVRFREEFVGLQRKISDSEERLAMELQRGEAAESKRNEQASELAKIAKLIIDKDRQLDVVGTKVKEQNAVVSDKNKQLVQLKAEFDDKQREAAAAIESLHSDVRALRNELAANQFSLQALLGSTSWRITQPFRRIVMIMRKWVRSA